VTKHAISSDHYSQLEFFLINNYFLDRKLV